MLRVIFLLFVSVEVCAQEFVPSQFMGMGSRGIASDGIYTIANNPAGIARLDRYQAALSYQQHFMGTDIQTQAIMLMAPVQSVGHFGLLMKNYGIPKVTSRINAGISYAKNFGENIHTSVSFNYHQHTVVSYWTSKTWSADIGFRYLLEHFQFGLTFKNISRNTFSSDSDQFVPQEFGVGLNYLLSEEVQVTMEVYKRSQEKTTYSSGIQYAIHPLFTIRGGASVYPTKYYAGVGMVVKKFVFDIANSMHTKLGSSPQLSIAYAF